jgi:hypothetical protein
MEAGVIDVQTRQRSEALGRANRVRSARATLKRRIAAGRVSAAEVILLHPWEVESMPVVDVLKSQRQWGDRRCRRLLGAVGLQEGKAIGSMTERQRLALVARLGARTSSARNCPGYEGAGVRG